MERNGGLAGGGARGGHEVWCRVAAASGSEVYLEWKEEKKELGTRHMRRQTGELKG